MSALDRELELENLVSGAPLKVRERKGKSSAHCLRLGLRFRPTPALPEITQAVARIHTEPVAAAPMRRINPSETGDGGEPAEEVFGGLLDILTADLPERFTLTLVGNIRKDGENRIVELARLRGTRRQFSGETAPAQRCPQVLVTSAGRSGSTALMELLCAHPGIAAPAFYPFEMRTSVYFWRAAQITSRPGNLAHSMSPDGFETGTQTIGYNPYFTEIYLNRLPGARTARFLSDDLIAMNVGHARAQTARYFAQLCRDVEKPNAVYLAEKTLPTSLLNFMQAYEPLSREIFLVRDFRDTLLSAIEFSRKRGYLSFGLSSLDFDAETQRARSGAIQLARSYNDRRDRCLLVRYEDFITDVQGVADRIFDFLDLPKIAVPQAEDRARDAAKHTTSQSAQDSVERWRRELSEEQRAAAAETFGEFLDAFGYPRA